MKVTGLSTLQFLKEETKDLNAKMQSMYPEPKPLWAAVIYGEVCSKSNSRRLVRFGTRPASIKSAKALSYLNDFVRQVGINWVPQITYDVTLVCRIFYASRRPDLDESLVMDALQKANVIKNDRQIREKHIYGLVDKENPRAEIEIWGRG